MTVPRDKGLVYALGDSHVRTYSYHDRFLPLYIGPGFANCFLTAELAAATEDKILLNLARVPGNCAVLLSLGEPDVRFHSEDRFGTRGGGDREVLQTAVARYAATLEHVRDSANVRLAVMNVPPSVDVERSRLALMYNNLLAESCKTLEVTFIDIWSHLVDARSGLLQPVYDADGIHLKPAILPALSRALREKHVVCAGFPAGPNFAWSFNYRVPLTPQVETRFWGDKPNASRAEALVDYVLRSQPAPESAAILNCREGYIALALAARGVQRLAATDPDPAKRRLAKEVVRFAQCPQVRVWAPGAFEAGARKTAFAVLIDYSPGRTSKPTPEYLERIAALGERAVVVADRAVLARHPGLAERWLIDETAFGGGAGEIIMDTRHN